MSRDISLTCADSGRKRELQAGADGMHLFFNDPRVAYVTRHRRIVRHPPGGAGRGWGRGGGVGCGDRCGGVGAATAGQARTAGGASGDGDAGPGAGRQPLRGARRAAAGPRPRRATAVTGGAGGATAPGEGGRGTGQADRKGQSAQNNHSQDDRTPNNRTRHPQRPSRNGDTGNDSTHARATGKPGTNSRTNPGPNPGTDAAARPGADGVASGRAGRVARQRSAPRPVAVGAESGRGTGRGAAVAQNGPHAGDHDRAAGWS